MCHEGQVCHDLGDMYVMRVRCVMIWGTCVP